jgi:hypothetical protein
MGRQHNTRTVDTALAEERSIAGRHHEHRPMRKLTELELDVLVQMGRNAPIFREHTRIGLTSLGALAERELIERDFSTPATTG